MALIQSIEADLSTSEVIDWLVHFREPFVRFNETDPLSPLITISEKGEVSSQLEDQNRKIVPEGFSASWYRRGFIRLQYPGISGNEHPLPYLNHYFNEECDELRNYIQAKTSDGQKSIGSMQENYINKLHMLEVAARNGFLIPDTLITCRKEDVLAFIKTHGELIGKGIKGGFAFPIQETQYYLHTVAITKEDVEKFPDRFPPSLFQKKIQKKYELRVFCLDGKCFTAVIFSQNDPKTSLDFRNYNQEKPNRVCPYKLPQETESKLIAVMKDLQMRSGSADLIKTTDNRFCFLEINPVGQFQQVSLPCNYHLEKLIAQTLIQNGNRQAETID